MNSQPGRGIAAEPDRASRKVLEGERMSEYEPLAMEVGRLDSWLAILDRYGVQYMILDKELDGNLISLVQSQPDWTVDFSDEASMLFSRSSTWGSES
jgi:hypothetical protein